MSSPLLAMPNLAAHRALKASKEVSAPSNTTFGRSPSETVTIPSCCGGGARRTKHRAARMEAHGKLDVSLPVKRHRGEPGHTRDTRDTRTHKGTRTTQTNLTTIQTHHNNTHPARAARQRDDRSRGRLNSRRPGADRTPRPTQKRPPPANPTLPPPAVPLPERLPAPARKRSAK